MRVVIARRERGVSMSMDVYADGLVRGLKVVRPNWEIIEMQPISQSETTSNSILRSTQKYYRRYWQYPKKVKAQAVDIIHVIDHSDGHLAYWFQQSAQPIVFTCHDLINFTQPENITDQSRLAAVSAKAWRYAVQGLRHADWIISVSEYTAKDVNRLLNFPTRNITVIPNAVEAELHQLSADNKVQFRQKYNIPADAFCLLNVGSNHPRKNIPTILRALHQLHQQGLSVHLLKVGADFTSEQKAVIIEHRLSNYITYAGKPDRSALASLYNVADVLIAPSFYEGFGMTILEAMACGTPVVTSNTSSLPEAAGDAAILVTPTDADAVVNAIQSLRKDNTLRETLIDRGLKRAKVFTWESTAEQVAQIYESVLHKSE